MSGTYQTASLEREALAADYIVIGAGAVGMAFVDTLLTETDATIALVDARDAPGGHWNDAYSFIRLHAPSIFYGVPSRALGGARSLEGIPGVDCTLATKPQLLDYYSSLLTDRFIASGRVQWLPRHAVIKDGDGKHLLRSLVTGRTREMTALRRLVDATRSDVQVPATQPPAYDIGSDVGVIAPEGLVHLTTPPERFCVIGGGKTAMDTCLWLLGHEVEPSRIRWIKPRESLVIDRAATRSFEAFVSTSIQQLLAVAEARSFKDFMTRISSHGLVSLDANVPATQFRGAMLARTEIEALRTIKDVVRLGHVNAIQLDRIELDRGSVAAEPDTMYIDCTAYGHNERGLVPVFEQGRINLQTVRAGEPLFSAAFTAFVEAQLTSDTERNSMCGPVPLPSTPGDLLRTMKLTFDNVGRWTSRPELMRWISTCRLDMLGALGGDRAWDPSNPLMQAFARAAAGAAARLPGLIAEADAANA